MKLFTAFAESGFHSSVVTTFDIDFEAYETVALARLRKAGCNNNLLLVDGRMLTYATERRDKLPRYAGRRYAVAGMSASGVFHPKLLLQLGPQKGRLVVASANMTSPGMAGNLEVVGEVRLASPQGPEAGLLRGTFDYLLSLLPPGAEAAREQLQWALRRTPWLRSAAADPSLVDGDGVTHTRLLVHNNSRGIGARFLDAIGPGSVSRLIAISPYWDEDLSALSWLQSKLQAAEVAVVVQKEAGLFPKHALDAASPIRIFPIAPEAKLGKASRFMHAKVLIVQTANADHVLYGSPNCTTAALGSASFVGANQEVAVYRRLAPGQAVRLLALQGTLAPEMAIPAESLRDFVEGEPIPLAECERRSSGSFELKNDILSWRRPRSMLGAAATLELLDRRGVVLPAVLVPLTDEGEHATFEVALSVLPAFARAVAFGEALAPSIVMSVDEIRRNQLPTKSAKARNALDDLEDPETLEGLRLLDIIHDLVKVEQSAEAEDGIERRGSEHPREGAGPEEPRVLTYEEFVQGRKLRTSKRALSDSSMSASLPDSVRQVVNRILGIGANRRAADEPDDEEEVRKLLEMGDETSDGEAELESGSEKGATLAKHTQTQLDARRAAVRRRQTAFKQTQRSIVKAVNDFLAEQRLKSAKEGLSTVDLLRLRVLLMVVLATGSAAEDLLAAQAKASRRSEALLPCRGDNSWPFVACRLLYEFFRQRPQPYRPLISHLRLSADAEVGLPVDVAECVLLCQWVVQAVRCASDSQGREVVPPLGIGELCVDVGVAAIALLGQAGELPLLEQTWSALERRYAVHLGVDGSDIRRRHGQTLQALEVIASQAPLAA
jgi:hypothetical protein